MVNLTRLLNEYLLENDVVEYETIFNDVFPDDQGDALISRYDPSRANEKEFIDGSAVGNVSLAYMCRSDDAEKCRRDLNAIINAVDGLSCTDSTNGTVYNFKAVTLPSFVTVDEKNQSVYSCDISVDYNRKGE